jgi:hypothetical protein
LTTPGGVVIVSNMNAELMLDERHIVSENAFAEMVVWRMPLHPPEIRHSFRYRLAFVINGTCVLRYDNESGTGDHRHDGEEEIPYLFTTPHALLNDFRDDVDNWRS